MVNLFTYIDYYVNDLTYFLVYISLRILNDQVFFF